MTERRFGRFERAWVCGFVASALFMLAAVPGRAQAAAASAQPAGVNLLANPNFETDTASWSPVPAWPALDAEGGGWISSMTRARGRDIEGSSASGSLEVSITADQGRCIQAIQCVAVTGDAYQLSGQVYLQTGFHTKGGWVGMNLFFMESPDCRWDAAPLAFVQATPSIDPAVAAPEAWIPMTTGPVPAPPATHSAQITLIECVPSDATSFQTVTANFTDLVFTATPFAATTLPKDKTPEQP
jgi:hypothetical protein